MRVLFSVLCMVAVGLHASADEYDDNQAALINEVMRNPLTANATWLELQNAFDQWEKVILIFGYADPGDFAACLHVRDLALKENPGMSYRCNPVD